jgi:AcrR family transcriptional regulator
MSATGEAAARAPFGRPRDESLDAAVLTAVRELLAEEGYSALTVHKVTQRSGVHAKTISRRWSTKAEMVAAAILGGDTKLYSGASKKLPTGDLRADLRELIARNLAYLAEPATRAAVPALLPQIEASERVFALFERRDQDYRDVIRAVLQRAVDSGGAPAHAAGKVEIVVLILSGATFNMAFSPARKQAQGIVEELLDTLLAAIHQPPPAAAWRHPGAGTSTSERHTMPDQ